MKAFVALAGLVFTAVSPAFSAPPDNGVPASEVKDWQEVWNPTTGSEWRTKTDARTNESVKLNPLTGEIYRNPANGYKAEAVYREDWINDGVNAASQKAAKLLSAPALDNGIPASAASQFTEIYNAQTSSSSRTVKNSSTGQTLTFDPKTYELRISPVTKRWEAVLREAVATGDTSAGPDTEQSVFNEARGDAANPGVTLGRPAAQKEVARSARAASDTDSGTGGSSEPDHCYHGALLPGFTNDGSRPQTNPASTKITIPTFNFTPPTNAVPSNPRSAPLPAGTGAGFGTPWPIKH